MMKNNYNNKADFNSSFQNNLSKPVEPCWILLQHEMMADGGAGVDSQNSKIFKTSEFEVVDSLVQGL